MGRLVAGAAFAELAVHHEQCLCKFGAHTHFELTGTGLETHTVLIHIGKAFFLVTLPNEEL